MSADAARIDTRRTVAVEGRCNNACVFCALPEGVAPDEANVTRALESARAETDAITFVGGEPTLVDTLVSHVARARALGFSRIGVQTNARLLAIDALANRLAAAGVTDVHVSLHGSEPVVHDYHTGMSGSLVQSLAGIGAARAAKLTVVATTVVTRSNDRSLAHLPRLLSTRGVAAWHLAVPWARGRAATSFDRVVPRLGLAMPFVLHAMAAAERLALPAFISGAPLCLLGPFASRSLDTSVNAERTYANACGSCAVRARCPGIDAWSLARFSGDELAARSDAPEPIRHPLASLFTGPHALADAPERVIPESPRESRRKLPVLMRPTPGAQEIRGPSKTGDALREIFPSLFEPKSEG